MLPKVLAGRGNAGDEQLLLVRQRLIVASLLLVSVSSFSSLLVLWSMKPMSISCRSRAADDTWDVLVRNRTRLPFCRRRRTASRAPGTGCGPTSCSVPDKSSRTPRIIGGAAF